ncbi:MAG: cell division protein FtsQ [Piscirickettsiaceae bacterium]|nr:MAG: cell division protein FtsQ [Piscirickettsiaceae bacterium]
MNRMLSNNVQQLLKWLALLVVFATGLWAATSWMNNPKTLPIKFVRIEGELKHINKVDVSTAISDLVKSGFFAVKTQQIITEIEKIEWVKTVRISRVWPDAISLQLTEQQPAAVWNKTFLLNQEGHIFRPKNIDIFSSLPRLEGDDAKSVLVLESLNKSNVLLKKIGFAIKALSMTVHGSWMATSSSGVVIKIGNNEPVQTINKSFRLLSVLNIDALNRITSVDMRYPNGMAVVWKEGKELMGYELTGSPLKPTNKKLNV